MAEPYSRIHRLLRILTLIQSRPGWNASRLARECGTSTRNVYRDLKMIEGAGIPYFFDEATNGYSVRKDFFLPPVELTLDESLALIALAEQIGGREQVPFMRQAARAIAKVRGRLPGQLQTQLGNLDNAIEIDLARTAGADGIADVYDRVRLAISRGVKLRCLYDSTSSRMAAEAGPGDTEPAEAFLFQPYRLYFNQRAWYAVGWHEGRDEVRTMRLSRFTLADLTDHPYKVPGDFSMEEYLGLAWRMIRGRRRYRVVLSFTPEFAETVADTHWHRTQQISYMEDGSIRFRCEVDGLEEIVWWVLSMGPHCRVEKPRELAAQVKKLAAGIVAQYEPRAAMDTAAAT